MSQRERPGAGGAAHPSAAAESPATRAVAARNGETAPATDWAALFPALAPAQQLDLLALANRQGYLHARQLPVAAHVSRAAGFFAVLSTAAPADLLSPLRPEAVQPVDAALDTPQRDAVAKALQTPDLCLIQGGPGTGKSRVIAEVIR